MSSTHTTPDGYQIAPSAGDDDHRVKMAIPLPGRDPVKVTMPKRNWMDPKDVKAYADWLEPIQKAWDDWNTWATENNGRSEADRTEPPFPEDDLPDFTLREVTLRWLRPYTSDDDFQALLDHCPDGTVEWIRDQVHGTQSAVDDVASGESSASTDS